MGKLEDFWNALPYDIQQILKETALNGGVGVVVTRGTTTHSDIYLIFAEDVFDEISEKCREAVQSGGWTLFVFGEWTGVVDEQGYEEFKMKLHFVRTEEKLAEVLSQVQNLLKGKSGIKPSEN